METRTYYAVVDMLKTSTSLGTHYTRMLVGITENPIIADLYVATHDGDCEIEVFDVYTKSELWDILTEEFGLDYISDQKDIEMHQSKDGLYTIVETGTILEDTLYETSVLDMVAQNSVLSFTDIKKIGFLIKEPKLLPLLQYFANKYATELVAWLGGVYYEGNYANYFGYPLDVIKLLIIEGYEIPVEHISEDEHYDSE